ncbi:GGDEF domain-containing protein [Sphingomonas sp. ID1715]|uniref:GGDEF domain-containing protein n=1 Tax=Sphingomonas sp. ID1715 TaxID=1656898 RepID=UPI0014882C87|nr:GGDEF domain-containing protein [Sphingomonas sp. ID1715]NNM76123.1 GGDEF domain-containing protein [Sphingomonas sp. ID1715]
MTVNDADLARENDRLRALVAELEGRIERLERLADSDTLTPLANRRFFLRAVERAVAQLARHGTASALLFIDLDRLKEINDAHGHGAGDEALIHTAWVLREKVRASDVVARLGGDEFGVLLEYADAEAGEEKAAALRQAVAARPLHGRIPIGVSIGVTALRPADTPEAALARADEAMYRAKRSA